MQAYNLCKFVQSVAKKMKLSNIPNVLLIVFIFFYSCEPKVEKKNLNADSLKIDSISEKNPDSVSSSFINPSDTVATTILSELEQLLIDSGLVNIRELDSTIIVDLRYSTENNFLGKDVYGDLNNCYLQPDVAEKLLHAQQLLKKEFPQYNLLVFDGVRPRSIQWKMWEMLDMPEKEKIKYVSNPEFGSLHNFGAAVDVSISDENGNELDMGTPFDFFGELAYPVKEQQLLKKGELSSLQIENRKLLRRVMYGSDFFNIQTEWWHFNSCYRKEAITKYKLIE